jgi:anionic cell wall polymer biosynthesis LytR-Cps2A-Psr (LCP) family protein
MNSYFKLGTSGKADKVEPGENVYLNGYQALCYARIRKLDSDFQRTERQQKIISAIIEKMKGDLTPAGVPKLLETAKSVAPYIETTLSEGDVLSLLLSMSSCVAKSGGDISSVMVSAQLPFEGTWWYSSEWDGSSISIDLEANKAQLYNILYEQTSQEEATQAQE